MLMSQCLKELGEGFEAVLETERHVLGRYCHKAPLMHCETRLQATTPFYH